MPTAGPVDRALQHARDQLPGNLPGLYGHARLSKLTVTDLSAGPQL